MTQEYSIANFKVKKIFEELRKKILDIPKTIEINGKESIVYSCNNDKFCTIKMKKDLLEIDFKDNKTIEDPMEFSWKIKSTKEKFDRRMQLKNIAQIDTAFGLIYQAHMG